MVFRQRLTKPESRIQYKDFVGIDVSQRTLDVVLRSVGKYLRVANTEAGMTKRLKRLVAAGAPKGGALSCFEHTGIFSLPLRLFLAERGILHVQVSSLAAKRSMGLKRGKTVKVDAAALADYAYRFREDLQPAPPPNRVLMEAKRFFTLREQLVHNAPGSWRGWALSSECSRSMAGIWACAFSRRSCGDSPKRSIVLIRRSNG
ncbi:MAG: transposase [Flavobacteriales bacterium]